LRCSTDGPLLASGSHDHTVRIRDVAGAKILRTITSTHVVTSVRWSPPHGQHLAVGMLRGEVPLWDVDVTELTSRP
jgi:WD40 repeat protein